MANLREGRLPREKYLFCYCPNWDPLPLPKLILTLFSKLKKKPKLRAGGEVIWTMPKRKGIFFSEFSFTWP